MIQKNENRFREPSERQGRAEKRRPPHMRDLPSNELGLFERVQDISACVLQPYNPEIGFCNVPFQVYVLSEKSGMRHEAQAVPQRSFGQLYGQARVLHGDIRPRTDCHVAFCGERGEEGYGFRAQISADNISLHPRALASDAFPCLFNR